MGKSDQKIKDAKYGAGQLRHLYSQMISGYVKDTKSVAEGLLGRGIVEFEALIKNYEEMEPITLEKALAQIRRINEEGKKEGKHQRIQSKINNAKISITELRHLYLHMKY